MPRQHTKQNIKAARKKVEIALEKYKMYLLTLPDDMLPKITSSYSIAPPSKTNQFYSCKLARYFGTKWPFFCKFKRVFAR